MRVEAYLYWFHVTVRPSVSRRMARTACAAIRTFIVRRHCWLTSKYEATLRFRRVEIARPLTVTSRFSVITRDYPLRISLPRSICYVTNNVAGIDCYQSAIFFFFFVTLLSIDKGITSFLFFFSPLYFISFAEVEKRRLSEKTYK